MLRRNRAVRGDEITSNNASEARYSGIWACRGAQVIPFLLSPSRGACSDRCRRVTSSAPAPLVLNLSARYKSPLSSGPPVSRALARRSRGARPACHASSISYRLCQAHTPSLRFNPAAHLRLEPLEAPIHASILAQDVQPTACFTLHLRERELSAPNEWRARGARAIILFGGHPSAAL